MSLQSAHDELEAAISRMLAALDHLVLDEIEEAELDAITTALCARSGELEEWIKRFED